MGAMIGAGIAMGMALGATYYSRMNPLPKAASTAYPPVPSVADPGVWAAGSSAARRAGTSTGRPQGRRWDTASDFVTQIPLLVGK